MAQMLNQYPSNHPISDRCRAQVRGVEDRVVHGSLRAHEADHLIRGFIELDEVEHRLALARNDRFWASY